MKHDEKGQDKSLGFLLMQFLMFQNIVIMRLL